MSKLDRFLVYDSFYEAFPHVTGLVLEKGCAREEDFVARRESLSILGNMDHIEAKDYAPKARIQWALEGDENTNVVRFVQEFNSSREIPIGCNPSFIALILKVPNANVIGDCVNPVQSAFIKGMYILDGPLILNEILAEYKYLHKELLVFKVDFEKAFDSVRWDFLDAVMEKINDVIFFGEWSRVNTQNLIGMLRCFYLISGLKVNVEKSKVLGVGVSDMEISQMASIIGCGASKLPFKLDLIDHDFANHGFVATAFGDGTRYKSSLGMTYLFASIVGGTNTQSGNVPASRESCAKISHSQTIENCSGCAEREKILLVLQPSLYKQGQTINVHYRSPAHPHYQLKVGGK
nr:RNA-directed DNA polymerase, eukaryota, reverse transcriptase zinc-binding domain protein [Tanacetum cinerariifolium]